MPDKIKVLIVEDSPTTAAILRRLVESDPSLELTGIATNGAEAIRMTSRFRPQVITMDVHMPHMSGIEATEYIMAHTPTPILVLTASLGGKDVDLSFKMLSAGALEIIEKPAAEDWENASQRLLDRLKLLSRIKVITHLRGKARITRQPDNILPVKNKPALIETLEAVSEEAAVSTAVTKTFQVPGSKKAAPINKDTALNKSYLASHPNGPASHGFSSNPQSSDQESNLRFNAVGIAASTGGPPALARLLKDLPADFQLPILLVQHIPAGFSTGLAEWLNGETALRVKNSCEGELPLPGTVYLSTDDRHLTVNKEGLIHLDDSPARFSLRPSADLLFESMALAWPGTTLAVILTGMGRDGTEGMQSLRNSGGINIAQDEQSSVIFGMPKSAIEKGVIDKVLSLNEIAPFLKDITRSVPLNI